MITLIGVLFIVWLIVKWYMGYRTSKIFPELKSAMDSMDGTYKEIKHKIERHKELEQLAMTSWVMIKKYRYKTSAANSRTGKLSNR